MEFLCFMFVSIAVLAAKAASKASKTSGAARGLWIAKKKGILERLREQEGGVIQHHTEDLRERASRFEPPPAPQDVLEEAERAAKNWGADRAVEVEEVLEQAAEIFEEPVVLVPDVEPELVVEPAPEITKVPEITIAPEPALVDLEPFVEVEEEFFDPLVDPTAAAFGGGLGVAVGAAVGTALSSEDESAQPKAAPLGDQLGGADLLALVDDLFESGRPGFEVKELFESEHLGRIVRWRAVIDRVESFRQDELLQDGPGVRVVTEYQPEDPGARRVRVDIGVDSETGALLERGKGLAFVGALSSCDPYLHSFTLRDARLV